MSLVILSSHFYNTYYMLLTWVSPNSIQHTFLSRCSLSFLRCFVNCLFVTCHFSANKSKLLEGRSRNYITFDSCGATYHIASHFPRVLIEPQNAFLQTGELEEAGPDWTNIPGIFTNDIIIVPFFPAIHPSFQRFKLMLFLYIFCVSVFHVHHKLNKILTARRDTEHVILSFSFGTGCPRFNRGWRRNLFEEKIPRHYFIQQL